MPRWIEFLPTLNAGLNATGAMLLIGGYLMIRRRRIDVHKRFMLAALGTSTLFMISYLTYHYHVGSKPFPGVGLVRPIYFVILISHIILAALVLPLALVTVWRAWTERFEQHAHLARWTLPIWLYVSVTGVIVYLMLYRLY